MTEIRKRFAASLSKRFHNDVAPIHFGDLLSQYAESGLSPPHLVSEIETAEEAKL
jgi:hypothetical protein